eukprot:s452_g10.t1
MLFSLEKDGQRGQKFGGNSAPFSDQPSGGFLPRLGGRRPEKGVSLREVTKHTKACEPDAGLCPPLWTPRLDEVDADGIYRAKTAKVNSDAEFPWN